MPDGQDARGPRPGDREASDPRAFADDVEKVTVIAGCGIGVFPSRTRSGGRPREPHEQRAAGIVLQIAHHPVRAFPLAGGKVVTADAFGVLREITQDVFGFQ